MLLLNKKEKDSFTTLVKDFYTTHGRHDLPWRQTKNPYHIMVSEFMLQQTQVERVLTKYKLFIDTFPDTTQLAAASLGDVLMLWQGLGYNRRAKYLHDAAKVIERDFNGVFPQTAAELQLLPGVGSYTAAAIAVFAFDRREVVIETNIRTVYIHHFFSDQTNITDNDIAPYIETTLQTPTSSWYAALMDYGSYLKKEIGNANKKSSTYKQQSRFAGSNRQMRGAIIRTLVMQPMTKSQLIARLVDKDIDRLQQQLSALKAEGLVIYKNKKYQLP